MVPIISDALLLGLLMLPLRQVIGRGPNFLAFHYLLHIEFKLKMLITL